mgnify:CR=1 FL=1
MGRAHFNEMVTFVKNAIPGQKVTARITKKRSSYLEARSIEVLSQSPHFIDVKCEHFADCGGCTFQNLDYNEQTTAKGIQVKDVFRRIGGFPDVECAPIIGCDETFHYRNKMEFSFSNQEYVPESEMERVIPVIQQLAHRINAPISIDTRRASVSRAAVTNGAAMVNDVSMLNWDKSTPVTVAELNVPLVISHNRRKSEYHDVMAEVISDLDQAVTLAIQAGIQTRNIIVDPGIGFGKTIEQSLEAQRRLNELHVLGLPVLVGTSRKSSIGAVLGVSTENRMEGTAATVALAIERGADLVRVHDVAKMLKVARMADAIVRGWAT